MGETVIAGIVLAAGFSRRLGRPKQLVTLVGETLLERAVRVAGEAGLRPLVVVLSPDIAEALQRELERRGCILVVNEGAAEGMAASIRLGVVAVGAENAAGAVVMTCDQIAVTAEHLRALCTEPGETAGSGYAGRVGVPAYFPASRFGELLGLTGDEGARGLLRGARYVLMEALAIDVDTASDLARAEKWLRSSE